MSDAQEVIPTDADQLAACLADPVWRLSNLYKIIVKGDDDDEGTVLPFRPNRAQRRFIARLWHRNIILKARQLGFTTLICIVWLDHALFVPNQRCGVIAHDRDAAKVIFRDKVKFAYENLPPQVLAMFPTREMNADEILFAHNNSSIRVATSMRSGTIHRLLVSEYGKICAKYPEKAYEVQTGSLPAVPQTGIVVIESTAEGQDGDFHDKTMKAQALADLGKPLGPKDFRFHFYAWWQEPKYRMPVDSALITAMRQQYIDETEDRIGQHLESEQWAWYFATLEGDFSGKEETMWREYPSFPEEAFKVSTEGSYYGPQLVQARRDGRITVVPYEPGAPVNTFWDLGLNDRQSLWFHQRVGLVDRFIDFYESEGEAPSHYVRKMQERGYVYGSHYLPHDGAARRVTIEKPMTYEEMLRGLGLKNIVIVPRITHVTTGIDLTREAFARYWFDEKKCAEGLAHLQNYKKQWNTHLGTWSDQPRHDVHSNAADAIRQHAQGFKAKARQAAKARPNWRTA